VTPDVPDSPINQGRNSAAKRDRFSLVSHDLRSALADILGGLHLIDDRQLDADARAHFERVAASGETLARLLEKTMTDDGPEPNDPVTTPSNIKLADFLEDVRRRWTGHAQEHGVSFSLDAAAGLPAIVTLDRVALDRVVANLIGNGIKHTDDGDVVLAVHCGPDCALIFEVRDQGPGLSDEALARLFEYEGRPETATKPGSGLGLFIAKELSDLLGASLKICNRRDGGGADATLRVPYDMWFDRNLRREANIDSARDQAPPDLTGLRILLAEDNKTNQLVASQMLVTMGAHCAVASDGIEALEMLKADEFDLALLDIEMPRMTGLELIKTIRAKTTPLSKMPLVALTAYVMREHRERINAAGADGIISKPLMNLHDFGQAVLDYYHGVKKRTLSTPIAEAPPAAVMGRRSRHEVVDQDVFDGLIKVIGPNSTAELLGKLQADADMVAEGLARGRRSLDLAEIRAQTHILISVAGAIGARGLQHIAQRLNVAANRNDADEIDGLCETCLSGLAGLQGFIHDQQAKAPPAQGRS